MKQFLAKRMFGFFMIASLLALSMSACTNNKSNGDRVGMVTKFSREGTFVKTWEGELNMTQTGMNSNAAEPFVFSIDRRSENSKDYVVNTLDSALQYGWKVKLRYRLVSNSLNFFGRRGNTNYFIENITVLDKDPTGFMRRDNNPEQKNL